MRNKKLAPSLFLDEVTLWVEGGRGGDGSLHFRREAHVPRGGPDGGDGGKGGDVILRVNPHLNSLNHLPQRVVRAGHGRDGGGGRCAGKRGEDLCLEVPPGTLVFDGETGALLKDLVSDGEAFVVARGGRGGKGNARFATATDRAPRKTTQGEPGEKKKIRLELRLLAHAGFVGFPNAGKSSLLRALTCAQPRVGDYPFTTLFPVLGVLTNEYGENYILADLPGICKGASEGVGLGEQFLKHIQRSGFLLEVLDGALPEKELLYRHKVLLDEIASAPLPIQVEFIGVILNKSDLIPLREQRRKREVLKKLFNLPVWVTSALTQQGISELATFLLQFFRTHAHPCPKDYAVGR